MLTCEGYKMFRGAAIIVPTSGTMPPHKVTGTWLYKPEYDCWYCSGRSYPAEIVTQVEDEDSQYGGGERDGR